MKNQSADSVQILPALAKHRARHFSAFFGLLALGAMVFLSMPQTARALYLTATNVQGTTPASWVANADWSTNTAAVGQGTGASQTGTRVNLSVIAGQPTGVACELVSNGVPITSGTGTTPKATFIRTPSLAAGTIFPGASLTLRTNTILMYKGANNQVDYYTNLIFEGGVICKAVGGTTASTAIITGAVQVVSQTYLSAGMDNNRVTIPSTAPEGFNLAAAMSGSGNLYIMAFSNNAASTPQIISGGLRNLGYHGNFIVQCGWLMGTNNGSLGTNTSVLVDPNNTLYKVDMPGVNATVIWARFDAGYSYNTAGTLILTNGGVMGLSQHCAFSDVIINGTHLSPGDHLYSELSGNFPNNFLPGGSDAAGSLTVQPYNPNWNYGFPAVTKAPESLSLYTGGMVHFSVQANFATTFQWLSNGVPLTSATNTTLVLGPGSADVVAGAGFSAICANNNGSVTSTVATVSIRTPVEPYESAVAALAPYVFCQLNETSSPLSTVGGATVFDNANSLNGLYGIDALNAFNNIGGPTVTNGYPGFSSANTAFQPLFSDANSTVTLPALGLTTNAMTIAAWINPSGGQNAAAGLVFCRGAGALAGLNYGPTAGYSPFYNLADFPLGYTWNNDPNTYNWFSGLFVPPNQWSLVALTVTPTSAVIYVFNTNGISSARHDYPHAMQTFNSPTLVGGDSLAATRNFVGGIDDVAIFAQALTRDQLSAMFYAASGVTNYPPIVVTPPAPESVYQGQTAVLTVVGGGSVPTTYQWQVDTGTGATNIDNGGQYSGADRQTLSIAASILANTGNYQVVLSNQWGMVTSAMANLTVNSSAGPAANITMSLQQPTGASWDTAGYWNDGIGGLGASLSAVELPGSTYEALPGSRVRSATTNSFAVFPGIQLTLDGSSVFTNNPGSTNVPISELRIKPRVGTPIFLQSLYFQKLVMNGGQIDLAPDSAVAGYITLGGEMDILTNAPVYNDSGGTGGDNVGLYLGAYLSGTGSFEYHGDVNGTVPFNSLTNNLNIAGTTNAFSGAWNIVSGVLLGSAPGGLGTNSISIGSLTSSNAALETAYDVNNTNAYLILYGKMYLHQNDTFKSVFVNGTPLLSGTYTFAALNSAYPGNFPASWLMQNGSSISNGSGSITVLSTPVPVITAQPQSVSVYPNQVSSVSFNVTAVGVTPLAYRWYTNGTVALSDTGTRSGSTSNMLQIANPAATDAGNYTVIVTNIYGSATSSVATLTLLTPGPAMNFTLDFNGTPVVEGTGADWDSLSAWNPGGQPASASKYANPGSTFEVVVGSRLRNPAGTNFSVFPSSQLTIDGSGTMENNSLGAVGEFRFKNNFNPATVYFPNLVLNGGQLDTGDNVLIDIQGTLTVSNNSTIYVDSNAANDRGYQIDSWLTGAGNLLWHQFSGGLGGLDLLITGTSNTFNGQWTVDQGALVGAGAGSLGTNSISVGMSGLTAALETLYDLNAPNASLTLGATGEVFLHQNDHFASVTINGTPLADGTYTFAQLNAAYPTAFPATWTMQSGSTINTGSGQIVVGSGSPSLPHITQIGLSGTTLSLSAVNGTAGGGWTLLQSANLALPLSQWETNSTGSFDGNGNLSVSLPNVATNAIEFYLLKVQ